MFTKFMDMHSGGGLKEKYAYIYIEASSNEAEVIFYNRFGHSPNRVTCTCCGEDYSVSESKTLCEATAYERGCSWTKKTYKNDGVPLKQYLSQNKKTVLVIYKKDILDSERKGEVPVEGYVWQ